jgi:LmbE family N-acetylglucosaminyl deacetylase
MALRDAGWRVVNLACSLGRPADRERRRGELAQACRLAGFELEIPEGLPPIGAHDDLALAQPALSGAIADAAQDLDVQLIVGPSPHDAHPGHEVVGRAIRDAVETRGSPINVMFWGLWGELPVPNVLVPFDAARLAEIQHALSAHAGELQRNRYDRLVESRAVAHAVLGPECVFGFGGPGGEHDYVELLTQVVWSPEGGWRLPAPREFDASQPLGTDAGGPGTDAGGLGSGEREIGWWLHAPSVRGALSIGSNPDA